MIKFETARRKLEKKPRAADKITEGLKEALAVAKGETKPHKVHKPTPSRNRLMPSLSGRQGKKQDGDETVAPATRPKKPISIRLDQDVIDYYKATGDGWQSRINEALRATAGL